MFFYDDKPSSRKNIKKKGFLCCVCQKPLKSEESMAAGMGPTCLERARFAESLEPSYLDEMTGIHEPAHKAMEPSRSVLIKLADGSTVFSTVISFSNSQALVIDRSAVNKAYETKGSMVEALIEGLRKANPMEIQYVSELEQPRKPELMKAYKNFQKNFRTIMRERSDFLLRNPTLPYYKKINKKKDLNVIQLANREELMRLKDFNDPNFLINWNDGSYHVASLLDRLSYTRLSEAKLFKRTLEDNTLKPDFKVKDFGLTDQEIMSGLQHSGKVLEKNMFLAFKNGNPNMILLIELHKKIKDIKGLDRLKVYRMTHKIVSNEVIPEDDKVQFQKLLTDYGIFSQLPQF